MTGLADAIQFFRRYDLSHIATYHGAPHVRSGKRSTRATPTKDAPMQEAIQARAYALWERTGNPDPFINWILAERQLKNEGKFR